MSADGGAAFPFVRPVVSEESVYASSIVVSDGMTLRDYFAAKAMQGVVASVSDGAEINPDMCAAWSYEMADAMLKAREA